MLYVQGKSWGTEQNRWNEKWVSPPWSHSRKKTAMELLSMYKPSCRGFKSIFSLSSITFSRLVVSLFWQCHEKTYYLIWAIKARIIVYKRRIGCWKTPKTHWMKMFHIVVMFFFSDSAPQIQLCLSVVCNDRKSVQRKCKGLNRPFPVWWFTVVFCGILCPILWSHSN